MTALPPEQPALFIDRNSGGRAFRGFLAKVGISVVLHDEQFTQKTHVDKWLQAVGEKGWLVVTGDDDTTRSPLFLQELEESQVFVFILHGLNGATAEGKARMIEAEYPRMRALAATTQAPAIWRIGREGSIRPVDFRRALARLRQRGNVGLPTAGR